MKWISYKFEDRAIEARYRTARMDEAHRQVRVAAYVTIALLLIFAPFDWLILRLSPSHIIALSSLRLAALAGIVFVLVRLDRLTDWHSMSRAVSLSASLILLHILVQHAGLQTPLFALIPIAVLAVFVIYTLLPLELETNFYLSGAFTLGVTWIWMARFSAQLTLYDLVAPPILLGASNIFGLVFSLQMRRARRQEFLAQERTQKANREKDATIETKNQLFAIVSHDLRNTIGTTVSIGELLTNPSVRLDPESHRTLLDDLAQNARDTYMLLDNLLQWARSETDDLKVRPAQSSVADLLAPVVAVARWGAEAKGLRLFIEQAPRLEVFADVIMIQSVLRNLLSNAVKFTPQGGEIRLSVDPVADARVRFQVRDTGVGIEPERVRRIFDPEGVVSTPGTMNEKGTGLGLQLCKRFIELHGESIEVSSVEGNTLFAFDLPTDEANFRRPQGASLHESDKKGHRSSFFSS